MPASHSLVDRLVEKFSVDDDGCWRWTAGLRNGYGGINRGPGMGMTYAHRVAYELAVGPIPNGLQIDHLCREPRCVNPDHLEAVTQRENILRGESLPAQRARHTACIAGHPWDAKNTYIRPDTGTRQCRACERERDRERLNGWARQRMRVADGRAG